MDFMVLFTALMVGVWCGFLIGTFVQNRETKYYRKSRDDYRSSYDRKCEECRMLEVRLENIRAIAGDDD